MVSGKAAGTNALMPGGTRVRLATSTDGAVFTRTGVTVLDQAATPSLLLSREGLPYLYVTAHQVDGRRDGAALSIGSADGATWKHCFLSFTGMPDGVAAVDPDVVTRNDGSYRMFFTGGLAAGNSLLVIHYADSSDGLTWAYRGVALQLATSVLDSVTFEAGGEWHMYTLEAAGAAMVHARSSDGASFRFADRSERTMAGQPYVLSQARQLAGVTRVFAFGPNGQVIRSFATADGSTLQAGTVDHLAFSAQEAQESQFVKDPAVVVLRSGVVLMAYATALR